jgi:2-aminoethylphosphonate-pyruvate transaminase
MEVVKPVKRNVLLNPGPATTTDTVKYAQVVPDICPREKEFVVIMDEIRRELVKVVHGDPKKHTAVLFTGSGTVVQDVLINSLVPANKKICVVNNGSYSSRMVEIAQYYHIPCVDLKFPSTGRPDLKAVSQTLDRDQDIAVVATTHHETGKSGRWPTITAACSSPTRSRPTGCFRSTWKRKISTSACPRPRRAWRP